jgi:hypothetical protein
VVYLVGDGGDVLPGDPVMDSMRADLSRATAAGSTEAAVLFLGDNIYPDGVRPPEDGQWTQDVAHLQAQAEVVRGTGAPAIFIPGNHDWDSSGDRGPQSIRRQHQVLQDLSGPDLEAVLLPADGCPGPVYRELPGLRMIFLDTEWLIQGHAREPACPGATIAGTYAELETLIASAGDRHVLVAAHHPILTRGPHGGYFPADRHLFPLRDWKDWAYLPLPIFGSLYVWIRGMGNHQQDLGAGAYREVADSLEAVFRRADPDRPPLAYAAGHEHSLQVIPGDAVGVGYVLVSGSAGKTTAVTDRPYSLGAWRERGYMKIEVDGNHAWLTVVTMGEGADQGSLAWCHALTADDFENSCPAGP